MSGDDRGSISVGQDIPDPITGNDDVCVNWRENGFADVGLRDDELLHCMVAERTGNGENAIDTVASNKAARVPDALDLLGHARLVVQRESDAFTIVDENCTSIPAIGRVEHLYLFSIMDFFPEEDDSSSCAIEFDVGASHFVVGELENFGEDLLDADGGILTIIQRSEEVMMEPHGYKVDGLAPTVSIIYAEERLLRVSSETIKKDVTILHGASETRVKLL